MEWAANVGSRLVPSGTSHDSAFALQDAGLSDEPLQDLDELAHTFLRCQDFDGYGGPAVDGLRR